MSVQHGSSSLDPSDYALAADLRSAVAEIKNGVFLSSSQAPLAERINFVAPPQVDEGRGTLMTDKPLEEQSTMSRALALFKPGADPVLQSSDTGQPVLDMKFCINRKKDISRLADNTAIDSSYGNLKAELLFKKFRRDNSSGDPYYCVSADILGRAIHTFQLEYVSRSQLQKCSEEFDLHVKELVEEAKQSMSKDAVAIRMRKQNLVDQQHRLREEARIQCENAFADVNRRMKETSDAYCLELESQLKSLEESTITKDTLLDEMVHASQFQRDRIRTATAIPPLVIDENRLQLQLNVQLLRKRLKNSKQHWICVMKHTTR